MMVLEPARLTVRTRDREAFIRCIETVLGRIKKSFSVSYFQLWLMTW